MAHVWIEISFLMPHLYTVGKRFAKDKKTLHLNNYPKPFFISEATSL